MAEVNGGQVSRVAQLLKANPPKTAGLNFYSFQTPKGEVVAERMYPPLDHPMAVDFFFLACLHQYGFWYGDAGGYLESMVGELKANDGTWRKLKGSDLLWEVLRRSLSLCPEIWAPERLAAIRPAELQQLLCDDSGTQWPDFDVRLELTRSYGQWLVDSGRTPAGIVAEANATTKPLEAFLRILRLESPFGRDSYEKKALLLAMALTNRPERFLRPSAEDSWAPIVDYHLMRVALRLGLVDLNTEEQDFSVRRAWMNEFQEGHIRGHVWQAVSSLIRESGLAMSTIDETLWMARKYCPEAEEPTCAKCLFESVCAKRTKLFQPVFRTTAY